MTEAVAIQVEQWATVADQLIVLIDQRDRGSTDPWRAIGNLAINYPLLNAYRGPMGSELRPLAPEG